MEDEKSNSYASLFFLVFVAAIILIMQLVHKDFNKMIPEHNKKIVLIYDSIPETKTVVLRDSVRAIISDSLAFDKDTLEIVNIPINIFEKQESTTSIVNDNSDSIYFDRLVNMFGLEGRRKGKPIIRYYTKPLDGQLVFDLDKYGYYVHERHSKGLDAFASNAIFYGDSIKIKDLQLIAYLLISNGMDIKEISPSRYEWKYNALEIGTDTTILNNPSIEISELRNLLSRP